MTEPEDNGDIVWDDGIEEEMTEEEYLAALADWANN